MENILPKISVIVPVYNAEKYLNKCIDSILNQTFTNFELLLIDDGSKDNSGVICDEYAKKDKRVRVFHLENGGVSTARNSGIENAIGEWINFVDSDDWLEQEVFNDVLKKIRNIKVDLVIWGYRLVYPNYSHDIIIPYEGYFINNTDTAELLILCDLKKLLESPCNKLYSNEIIKNKHLRFDFKLSLMEDSKFNWSYFNSVESICSIQKIYYNYRINHNRESLSSKHIDNLIEIRTENVIKRLNYFINYVGKYKNQYLTFLEKDIEMAHLELLLELYTRKVSAKKRRENIKYLLKRGNIDLYKGGSIFKVLSTKNILFIDIVLKLRYLINKFIPILFALFQKLRLKQI
ncbi:MAG: glycosyltransferase family 2 protein [Paludibacter sp.]|nr:glycosyltransferase family 2 protein [Paludibacter sp.]